MFAADSTRRAERKMVGPFKDIPVHLTLIDIEAWVLACSLFDGG